MSQVHELIGKYFVEHNLELLSHFCSPSRKRVGIVNCPPFVTQPKDLIIANEGLIVAFLKYINNRSVKKGEILCALLYIDKLTEGALYGEDKFSKLQYACVDEKQVKALLQRSRQLAVNTSKSRDPALQRIKDCYAAEAFAIHEHQSGENPQDCH